MYASYTSLFYVTQREITLQMTEKLLSPHIYDVKPQGYNDIMQLSIHRSRTVHVSVFFFWNLSVQKRLHNDLIFVMFCFLLCTLSKQSKKSKTMALQDKNRRNQRVQKSFE